MKDKNWTLGTRIVMDEEKIKREGVYPLETIYENIDAIAEKTGVIKEDKTLYYAKEDKNSFEKLNAFALKNLIHEAWFTENVKEWIWIEKECETRYASECDLTERCKKEKTYFGLEIVHHDELIGAKGVLESDIKKLPFYDFWLKKSFCSEMLVYKETDSLVYLYDWKKFCSIFIRDGN